MLTPGSWLDVHKFWIGFFNPTYFPSLFFRTAICLALAGIYALITASVQKDKDLKARIVRWGALWTIPSLLALIPCGYWYIREVPAALFLSARGPMPTATHYAFLAWSLLAVTFVLMLLALFTPRRMHLAFALVIGLVALGAMDSFEFVREDVRKPFVIENYLYDNSLYAATMPGDGGFTVDNLNAEGVLNSAAWINVRTITPDNQVAVGHEIFRVECQAATPPTAIEASINSSSTVSGIPPPPAPCSPASPSCTTASCHPSPAPTPNATRSPPISTPSRPSPPTCPADGKTIYQNNCSMCHQDHPNDHLSTGLAIPRPRPTLSRISPASSPSCPISS